MSAVRTGFSEPSPFPELQERRARLGRTLRPYRFYISGLLILYAGWLIYVSAFASFSEVLSAWPVAVAMAFGSFVAGSTPMGGGTIGFPILVLGFDYPAALGRDFSLAIQSVGMTSAGIFILIRRQAIARRLIVSAALGSAIATPLGLLFVAPYIPDVVSKVVFAVLWASFGLLHLARLSELTASRGFAQATPYETQVGFAIGIVGGGFAASLTGVGIDMLLYVFLMLLFRADLKAAIPSSVILMAVTSLIGSATQLARGAMAPGLITYWLAAAPIVAVGAPLGALATAKMGRKQILVGVSILCLGQFAWTMAHEIHQLGIGGIAAALLAVVLVYFAFVALNRLGRALHADREPPPPVTTRH